MKRRVFQLVVLLVGLTRRGERLQQQGRRRDRCRQPAGRGAPGLRGKLKIAVIPKGTTHEFWKPCTPAPPRPPRSSASRSSGRARCKEDDREEQIDLVEEPSSPQGVDGIVLAPLDDAALG